MGTQNNLKRNLVIILLSLVCLLVFCAIGIGSYALGSGQGYQSGHTNGKQTGYNQGHTDGYSQGKTDGYTAGYAANSNSGYATGYNQGQTDELGMLLDWQMNTCTLYSNGYYQFKLWRAYDGTTKYTCLVQTS